MNENPLSLGFNKRDSIGHSIEGIAHVKSNLNLLHFFNFSLLKTSIVRMNNGILIVLLELQVFSLEIIKFVVEVKAGEIISKLAL